MTFEEALKSLTLKFTSGNDIPIERTTLTREEWDAILPTLCKAEQDTQTPLNGRKG